MSTSAEPISGAMPLPNFLLPETTATDSGSGPEIDLGAAKGGIFLLTLGITRIIEQESLDLSVWGSTDKTSWGAKPIAALPQKFYCGTYSIVLDLSAKSDLQFLRVQWKMNRWGRGGSKPMFDFYVFLEAAPVAVGASMNANS